MKFHGKFEMWMCIVIANIHMVFGSRDWIMWYLFALFIIIMNMYVDYKYGKEKEMEELKEWKTLKENEK